LGAVGTDCSTDSVDDKGRDEWLGLLEEVCLALRLVSRVVLGGFFVF
jgi:hypothetical protein